jgi:hypothetical protein
MIKSYDLATNKAKLWEIYTRCNRSEDYYNPNVASTTNVFIDDADDCAYIEQNVIKPLGIPDSLLKNEYDDSAGYNFNVVKPGGFVKPHRDVNSTKVNILLNEKTDAPFLFVDTQEKYYYEHPVLLDVSQLHTVDNCESIQQDRVTLQLFLTQPYAECERIIDENRTYKK